MKERITRQQLVTEYQLMYDYGDGLEVLCTEKTLEDAKSTKQWYIKMKGLWPAICRRKVSKAGVDQNGLYGNRV